MKWMEIKIKTTTDAVDMVSNILYDAGITGVAIEDPNDPVFTSKLAGDWDYFDETILNFEFEGAIVKGYLAQDSGTSDKINIIKESISLLKTQETDCGDCEVIATEVDDEDWANEWKKYYKPKKVTENIVIKPTWEEYNPSETDMVIEMDPGGAFGTGTHETTMMCIGFIEKYISSDMEVFDIGCGSGILGIAAAKLGAKHVVAVDIDQAAIDATNENSKINNTVSVIDVRKGNLLDVVDSKADMVVANIIADVIIFLADDVRRVLKENAKFISSGIINDKLKDVKEALIEKGFEIVEEKTMGEWSAVVSTLKKG